MHKVYILIILFLSFSLSAKDSFDVPKEEIGKTGLYTVKEPGVPVHPDYKEIYRLNFGDTPPVDSVEKYIVPEATVPKYLVYCPESYDPKKPAGIALFGIQFKYSREVTMDMILKTSKKLLEERNLIAVIVNSDGGLLEDASKSSNEASMLIRRSLDIVKERYEINEKRIFLLGFPGSNYYCFKLLLASPQVFKHSIFCSTPHMFKETINFQGEPIISLSGSNEGIKYLKEASKNRIHILYAYSLGKDWVKYHPATKKKMLEARKTFKKYNFKNTTFEEYKFIGKNIYTIPSIFTYIDKIDPDPFNPAIHLKNAKEYEAKNNFKEALISYKEAAEKGSKTGLEKYNELKKDLDDGIENFLKLHLKKHYPDSNTLGRSLVQKYGAVNCKKILKFLTSYSSDKKIVLEIKAAAFLAKAEAALKQTPPPKDKIKAACEKVIKTVPGTKTAEKAQSLLDQLK